MQQIFCPSRTASTGSAKSPVRCRSAKQTCDLTPKNEAINFAVTRPIFSFFQCRQASLRLPAANRHRVHQKISGAKGRA